MTVDLNIQVYIREEKRRIEDITVAEKYMIRLY
jgi:hypothetical protein